MADVDPFAELGELCDMLSESMPVSPCITL